MDRAPKQIAAVTPRPRAGDAALAARLRREIRGEVLFDPASRAQLCRGLQIIYYAETDDGARVYATLVARK